MINPQKNNIVTEDAEQLVKWLASFGQSNNNGVNRVLYSNAWVEAQHALKIKMEDEGFLTHFDSVGNLFGRIEGTEPGTKTILTGSHIDTVAEGGVYDGVYGIIASFLAARRLRQKYGDPKKSIEVVSLSEEEGSRFPLTFWGSRNITGRYTIDRAGGVADSTGISLTEAMKEAGFDPAFYQSPKREDIACFLELHIEQGLVLEEADKTIGLVSHIVGQRRFTITVTGESNHAGTTPMRLRRDAMAATAEIISYLTSTARKTDPDLVATVGKITAKPNTPNVIAGEVVFTLDVRHHQKEVLDHYGKDIFTFFEQTANELGVAIYADQWMDVEPVAMDKELTELARESAASRNISFQPIVSGAGHDAQVFGSFCPTALLFVPSVDGISHSPKEFTKKEDLESGVEVLTELLYRLAY